VSTPPVRPPRTRRTFRDSRLQQWLDAQACTSAQLERETGMSRQSTTQIRGGRDLRLTTMLRILRGCRTLAGRKVLMDEVFDLDPDSPANVA
jgi:hypothetical protein